MILSRPVVLLIALAGVAVVLLANAHLVYVAWTSQPACVTHSKADAAKAPGRNGFSAAQSAC